MSDCFVADASAHRESVLEDWAQDYLEEFHSWRCVGRQVRLPSGRRLDLLFEDGPVPIGEERTVDNVGYVVVELKSAQATPRDVAQLCDYVTELRELGWGRSVKGLLLAPDIDNDAQQIIRFMPDVGGEMIGATFFVTRYVKGPPRHEDVSPVALGAIKAQVKGYLQDRAPRSTLRLGEGGGT